MPTHTRIHTSHMCPSMTPTSGGAWFWRDASRGHLRVLIQLHTNTHTCHCSVRAYTFTSHAQALVIVFPTISISTQEANCWHICAFMICSFAHTYIHSHSMFFHRHFHSPNHTRGKLLTYCSCAGGVHRVTVRGPRHCGAQHSRHQTQLARVRCLLVLFIFLNCFFLLCLFLKRHRTQLTLSSCCVLLLFLFLLLVLVLEATRNSARPSTLSSYCFMFFLICLCLLSLLALCVHSYQGMTPEAAIKDFRERVSGVFLFVFLFT